MKYFCPKTYIQHYLTFLILCAILALDGCGRKETQIISLAMLKGGKTFAVPTGTVADQFVLKKFPDAKIEYYNTILDCAVAVKDGKADAAVFDKPVLKNIVAKNDGLLILPELLFNDQYGFAVQLSNMKLKNAMDEVLAGLKSEGTYDDMLRRWFPDKGNPAAMPVIRFSDTDSVLRFGTAAVTEPMSFYDANKNIVGFDIEFASYVAKKLGKRLEIDDMEFGAMLPALISGKVDMIGAGLSITEERAKKVLFSQCYYPSGIAAVVKDHRVTAPERSGSKLKSINDVRKKRIGVLMGSVHDAYAIKHFPQAEILQFQNISDMLFALNSEKVDVAFIDYSAVQHVQKTYQELGVLTESVFVVPIGAGFNKENGALREQFNVYLKEIRANGIYDDMIDRWMTKGLAEMPEIKANTTQGTLNVGVVSDLGLPSIAMQGGQLIGFDIEVAKRFCAWLGKEFVPVDLQFGSLIASISTKKIDMITSSMMITEERKKQIDFSDPYFESGVSLLAKKKNIERKVPTGLAGPDDLADKKIGVFTGTVHDSFVSKKYPQAEIFRYESTPDMVMSVRSGKVDAAMVDLVTAKLLIKHNPDLGILTENILNMPLGIGFEKSEPELRKQFNDYLQTIRKDGTYDTLYKRWFVDDPEKAVMPPFRDPGSGRKLVVGVSVDDLPYVAIMEGKYVGFDIEMLQKFAEHEKYRLEIVMMEFPSLVSALAAGKVEMIADGIAISEERKKQVDFSDPYAEFRTAVITQKKNLATYDGKEYESAGITIWKKISNSFYNNIIYEKRYLHIVEGLKVTILISILAALFGTVIGGLVCYMRMSKRKILSGTAKGYISVLRGTPVLVLLMIIYYVVFASVNISPVFVAVIAFGLNFGAYVSEMFRTSIESIDKGQKEAAIAGGFTKIQTFLYIILPQALRHILPVYKGEFISLIKMTSIVGYIAVQDLTKASDIIRSRTFDAFFPLIMVAVLYFLIAWLLTWALGFIEVSVDPKRKRIKKIKEGNQ